jgi:Tfp pilus assembly pilus retraction ATPase PilT
MMMTKAVAKLIQTDQSHQIPSQMQMGRDLGMQLLDQALLAAIAAREIDPDDAYAYASDKRRSRNSSPTPACCRSSTFTAAGPPLPLTSTSAAWS